MDHHISKKELAMHCKHRTRGVGETTRLIKDLIDTFASERRTQWGYLCLTLVPCSRYGRSSSATLHASKIPRVSSFVPGRVQKRKVGLSFQCTGAQEVLLHWSPSTTILTVSFQVIITKVGHSCSSYYICRGVILYYFQPNCSKC